MTAVPTVDELRAILRDIQGRQGLADLARVSGVSEGTLFRHARPDGAENRPSTMEPKTISALTDTFHEIGLLEGYDLPKLREAVEKLRKLPNPRSSDAELASHAQRTMREARKQTEGDDPETKSE